MTAPRPRALAVCASVVLVLAGVMAGCGGRGPAAPGPTASSTPPSSSGVPPAALCTDRTSNPTVDVSLIAPALVLVRGSAASLDLSEVNVTQNEVNVFVVRDGKEYPYVVCGAEVIAPAAGEPYDGRTFRDGDVTVTASVLAKVEAMIRDAHVVAFSVTPGPGDGATGAGGGLEYIATLTAPSGQFRVLLAPDGSVLATE